MNVVMLNVSEIKPYENNPRINDKAVDKVAESIKQYGWQQPIVVDKNYVIVAGHSRYAAAKKLGMEIVPVQVASDLTDDMVRSYRISDNMTNTFAQWDFPKLNIELDCIPDNLFTGFAVGEVFEEIDLGEVNKSLNITSVVKAPQPETTPKTISETPKEIMSLFPSQAAKKDIIHTLVVRTKSKDRLAKMEEVVKSLLSDDDVLKFI
jgi:site-specific DNA-methyltransferase (adenine-specific)